VTTLSQNNTDTARSAGASTAKSARRTRVAPARRQDAGSSRFGSILFGKPHDKQRAEATEAPEFFRDLNLDQIVDAVTRGRDEYNLKPLFYTRPRDVFTIAYRHEIMRDLESEALLKSIISFSSQMRSVRDHLSVAQKASYKYEKDAWFIEAVGIYGAAVEKLLRDLHQLNPGSGGLLVFRGYLSGYVASAAFKTVFSEARKLKAELLAIRYCLRIRGNRVTVCDYNSETDYSAAVEEVFAKFKRDAVKDYRVKFRASDTMNHVEGMILERVALLHPDVFSALSDFRVRNQNFAERIILDFEREIQFYVAWLNYAETFKRAGLKFCYPQVSDKTKTISSCESFDLALAGNLIGENALPVCNDFALNGPERIFVVTGPNQGGKTTFARTFGQLHYLASLGCPVPGEEAQLFFFDKLFTHFEREENVTTLRGKLEDDLLRIQHILAEATPSSLIIINEIFSSTTLRDAVYLSRNIMNRVCELDALGVCVTFLDELASLNEKTVSMVAGVVPEDPTLRTYKIERRAADGLSYAHAIAHKYSVTYEQLKERINANFTDRPDTNFTNSH
jgi:DNA mismatch repair protein MutS